MTLPVVSDHALLRYLERRLDIDVAALRRELADKVRRGVEHGADGVAVDGVRFILDQDRIVTVVRKRCKPR